MTDTTPDSLAAASTAAAAPGTDGAAAPARPVSPIKRVAGDFAESWVAMVGLVVLLAIIAVALLAPLISPQDPYDLGQIDVRDSRLPPGSTAYHPAPEQDFDLTIDPVALTVGVDAQTVERPVARNLGLTVAAIDADTLELRFAPSPADALSGLELVRIDDLPRGATLSAGEKHSFRSFWTLTEADLQGLRIRSERGFDGPFTIELAVEGTATEVRMQYWLGTDAQGRDMLSAILYGLRTSLSVGVLSGVFALVIGMSAGLTAAYFGGKVDTVIMRIVDLQLSFPAILVALMLLAVLGRGVDKVILALIIVQWAYYARTARSAALVERRKEYIEAAQCLALSTRRIIFVHLLPNCLPPVIVVGTVQVANAIALEATLSFLGIGLPVTEPSLGLLISNGFDYLLSGRFWISVYPGVALLITIVAINLVGDRLRDVLNPRLQR